MAGEGEGHDKEPGELFEDLDKFFAPLQGSDWPVPEEQAGGFYPTEQDEPEPEQE